MTDHQQSARAAETRVDGASQPWRPLKITLKHDPTCRKERWLHETGSWSQ